MSSITTSGKAVDEQQQIEPLGAAAPLPLDDGKLIHHQEIVRLGPRKIHQRDLVAAVVAVFLVRYLHFIDQQTVELLVIRQRIGRSNALHRPQGLLPREVRHLGIEFLDRRPQPPDQNHLREVVPLGGRAVGADARAAGVAVAQSLEFFEGVSFEVGFLHGGGVFGGRGKSECRFTIVRSRFQIAR